MTNHIKRSGTRKRHVKPVHGKMTLKYGGGKKLEWAKRHLVPGPLARRLGWRKSVRLSPPPLGKQPSVEIIAPDDSEEERELAAAAKKAQTNPPNSHPPRTQKTSPEMPTVQGMRYIHWANLKRESPEALNPNELYISAKQVREMNAEQQNTREVLNKYNFQSPPKTPPKLPPKLMNQSIRNEQHIYNVLPPRRQNTPSQPSRNSLKKTNAGARWAAAMAAQKPPSPKTRKSPPRENVKKLAKLFETGKTKYE